MSKSKEKYYSNYAKKYELVHYTKVGNAWQDETVYVAIIEWAAGMSLSVKESLTRSHVASVAESIFGLSEDLSEDLFLDRVCFLSDDEALTIAKTTKVK